MTIYPYAVLDRLDVLVESLRGPGTPTSKVAVALNSLPAKGDRDAGMRERRKIGKGVGNT